MAQGSGKLESGKIGIGRNIISMATYKSEEKVIGCPAEKVFDKVNDLEGLGRLLANLPADKVPEDKRAMLEGLKVTADSISIPAGPVGAITLVKSRSERPEFIEMTGQNSPVPMSLSLRIRPLDGGRSAVTAEIDLNIPPLLKPMVSGPIQKMISQFGDVLGSFDFG